MTWSVGTRLRCVKPGDSARAKLMKGQIYYVLSLGHQDGQVSVSLTAGGERVGMFFTHRFVPAGHSDRKRLLLCLP